jgi:hypothetical protein
MGHAENMICIWERDDLLKLAEDLDANHPNAEEVDQGVYDSNYYPSDTNVIWRSFWLPYFDWLHWRLSIFGDSLWRAFYSAVEIAVHFVIKDNWYWHVRSVLYARCFNIHFWNVSDPKKKKEDKGDGVQNAERAVVEPPPLRELL